VLARHRCVAVTVVGEAGLGKSRLLHEFERWVAAKTAARADGAHIFHGRARPPTQSQPYGLLRDVLAEWLRIADDDSMELAKHKLEHGIASLFSADDGLETAQAHAHLLGHLIGLDFAGSPHIRGIRDDGGQLRRRGFHAAAQALRRVSARDGMPIVLMVDDLHWADDGSIDFLVHLGQANADVPTLLLALTRPLLFERHAAWPGLADARRIALGPLGKAESHVLADELLRKLDPIPPPLHDLVTGGAEGNPFYMEELIKMLADLGALVVGGDRWVVLPDKLKTTRVPQTLTGVLQARLDSLKASEKQALQQASVIGFVFWDQALAAIDADAPDALPGVTRRELVVPRPEASLDGVREYAFHHQLLHQVTYDTVLKRLRRGYHGRVAAWLAGLSGARANDYLGLAAAHFDKAGDKRRASEYYTRAAEHAAARYAHEAVFDHVAHALAQIGDGAHPESLRLRWRLLAVRERALDLQGLRAAHQADIDTMQALAEALDDDDLRADAAKRRSYLAVRIADTATQVSAARQAMVFAERAGNVEIKLRAQNLLASGLCDQGDVASGRTLALEGLAAARDHGLRRVEGSFLNTLALIAVRLDDFAGHLEMAQQQWQVLRELGDRPAEAVARLHVGIALLGSGELTQSRCHLEEGLRLALASGDRVMEPYAQTYLALIALRQGQLGPALALAQEAYATSVAVGNVETQITALLQSAEIELEAGRIDAAEAAFLRAQALAIEQDEPLRFDAAAGLARLALARGDHAGALHALDGVLAQLADGGSLDGTEARQRIRLTCHQALAATGDPRAFAILAEAHADMQRQAQGITDAALQRHFLHDVPEHRGIAAAWAAWNGRPAGGA
jgi:tetratricopeptide (TPR) repeat protein